MTVRAARKLAELRHERGLWQQALASRLGLIQATVSRTEHEPDPLSLNSPGVHRCQYLEAVGYRLELTAINDRQPATLRLDHPTRASRRTAPAGEVGRGGGSS